MTTDPSSDVVERVVADAIRHALSERGVRLLPQTARLAARAAIAAMPTIERLSAEPTATSIAAGMDAWERTAGTREDMLRNAFVAMQRAALSAETA